MAKADQFMRAFARVMPRSSMAKLARLSERERVELVADLTTWLELKERHPRLTLLYRKPCRRARRAA